MRKRFSEQRGQLSSVFCFVFAVLVFPELGMERPHDLGNTARSFRSSIPRIGIGSCVRTLRVGAKALDEPDCFLSQRILWGPRAELFKGLNPGLSRQAALSGPRMWTINGVPDVSPL